MRKVIDRTEVDLDMLPVACNRSQVVVVAEHQMVPSLMAGGIGILVVDSLHPLMSFSYGSALTKKNTII